jgi:hypothetical protein
VGSPNPKKDKKGDNIMLLIIEIMLTISAWKKGWKAWVIVPWAVLFLAVVALAGEAGSEDAAFGIGLAGDILLIIVLGIMTATAHGPQPVQSTPSQSDRDSLPTTVVNETENH